MASYAPQTERVYDAQIEFAEQLISKLTKRGINQGLLHRDQLVCLHNRIYAKAGGLEELVRRIKN